MGPKLTKVPEKKEKLTVSIEKMSKMNETWLKIIKKHWKLGEKFYQK